jgi:magnesium transporter
MTEKTEEIRQKIQELRALLEREVVDRKAVSALVESLHPEDLATILPGLGLAKKLFIFRRLDIEGQGVMLEETDLESKKAIMEAMSPEVLGDVLDEMGPDEVADLVDLLPDEEEEEVLAELEPEHAEHVRELLEYDPESAGGIMTQEYIAVSPETTTREIIERIQTDEGAELVSCVYVTDPSSRLIGVASIRQLLTNKPETPIRDFMASDVISVTVDMDREQVARLVDRYNFPALPVIDEADYLKGVVTMDDVIDVIREEASEDILRLAGASTAYSTIEPIHKRAFHRLPWLITTLGGGLLLAVILRAFGKTLEKEVALTFFMPALAAMGGSAGLQSSTIMVRGLATGEIGAGRVLRVIGKEIVVGLLVGLVCGVVVGIVASLLQMNTMLGVIVGIAMFSGISVATTVGSLVPMICLKIGIDPALAAGPFVTTMNDIAGLVIYFGIASLMLFYM